MSELILNDEQAQAIRNAPGQVTLRDSAGNYLGFVARDFTSEDVAEAKRRLASDEPRMTTQEVLKYLDSLEHSQDVGK